MNRPQLATKCSSVYCYHNTVRGTTSYVPKAHVGLRTVARSKPAINKLKLKNRLTPFWCRNIKALYRANRTYSFPVMFRSSADHCYKTPNICLGGGRSNQILSQFSQQWIWCMSLAPKRQGIFVFWHLLEFCPIVLKLALNRWRRRSYWCTGVTGCGCFRLIAWNQLKNYEMKLFRTQLTVHMWIGHRWGISKRPTVVTNTTQGQQSNNFRSVIQTHYDQIELKNDN